MIHNSGTKKKVVDRRRIKITIYINASTSSFNFFNLVQRIVICGHICIVNFVESNNNWVTGVWVLSNEYQQKD